MPKLSNPRRPAPSSGGPGWSWLWFPFPGFVLPFPFPFSLGLVMTLPFLHWVGPFTDVSLQRVVRWTASYVLLLKPTLRSFVANSPTPVAASSKTSLLTTLGLESESLVQLPFAFYSFHLVVHPFLVSQSPSQLEL